MAEGSRAKELEDEVKVLKAIYAAENSENVKDLRKRDPWKVWRPPELLIALTPSRGVSGCLATYAQASLQVKCGPSYPDLPPELKIVDPKGLSEQDVKDLECLLFNSARDAIGEVMLMDLCQIVCDFLHSRNHPPKYSSFYDGMLQERARKAHAESLNVKALEESEVAHIKEEIMRRRREVSLSDRNPHEENKRGTQKKVDFEEQGDHQSRLKVETEDCGRARSSTVPARSPSDQAQVASPRQTPSRRRSSTSEIHNEEEIELQHPKDDVKQQARRRSRTISSSSSVVGPGQSTILSSSSTLPTDPFASTRLENEFEFINWIGKGGYGNVMKVKNRLDDNDYAIKKIPLDPQNRNSNRKMLREVKLLSKLNHENVVRYYNSWLETREVAKSPDSIDTTNSNETENDHMKSKNTSCEPLDKYMPDFGRPQAESSTAEWSTSFASKWGGPTSEERKSSLAAAGWLVDSDDSSSEDEDSSDDEAPKGNFKKAEESSDRIVFESDGASSGERELSEAPCSADESQTEVVMEQTLYIQMEYCEKNSLRELINTGELLGQPTKAWTLFREILEGLHYIHTQAGMIHRDIKPVNIFLDGQSHAKIGDFGLATSRQNRGLGEEDAFPLSNHKRSYALDSSAAPQLEVR